MKEKEKPVILLKGKEQVLLPFHLSFVKDFSEADSVNSALDDFYSKEFFLQKSPEKKNKKLIALEHSFEQQKETQLLLEKKIEEEKTKGELIYTESTALQEIIDAVKKGFSKGIKEEEIKQKINDSLEKSQKTLKILSLNKNKALIEFRE